MRRLTKLVVLALPMVLGTAGCLVEEEDPSEGRFGAEESEGVGGRDAEELPPPDGGTGGTSVENPGAGGNGSGAGGSNGGTGGNNTHGGGCSYQAPNSCLDANTLPAMPGDKDSEIRVVNGTTNQFIKVFIAEEVGSWISHPKLSFSAILENSPGMDFDLYVHEGGAAPECSSTPFEVPSGPVTATWGDNLNHDDGKWWVFEVRHKGGTACGSAAEWTLTIATNHAPSCESDNQCTSADHCVCPDCAQDQFCSQSCNNDNVCNSFTEGCGCGDCANTPYCLL